MTHESASALPTEGTEHLFVGNFLGYDVSVLDVAAATVVDTFSMGSKLVGDAERGLRPDSFERSPDGSVLYITRFPEPFRGSERATGTIDESGDLCAVDSRTYELLWSVELSGQPNHASISPDGSLVYVPIRDRNFVEVVDVGRQEIVGRAACGWGPHGMHVSADGTRLYVGTLYQDTLDVIDTSTLERVQSVYFGEAVRPFSITRDDRRAFVQLSKLHGFKVVDLSDGRITQTVDLPQLPDRGNEPARPYTQLEGTINHGMALTADESQLWLAASAEDFVAVYDATSLEVMTLIPVGAEPAYIHLNSNGTLCFVPNRKENTVSIISTSEMKEIERVPVGDFPNRMISVVL
ncbi:MAG TPA: cytochrome D1 domain-containing protein [Thermomicrobiales bacterium]|nr:cytochrome D1 domain-containing protein [Thermomicrobiales bacterium]